MEDAY
jgi:hypothetical protein